MGYHITQRASEFKIKSENKAKALEAIKALATQTSRMGGGSSTGERWFAWVPTEDFVKATTLPEAMGAWRWSVSEDEKTGDIIDIGFNGEKLGDDEILLEAIAPYVEPGSYIEIEGEEGALWRWLFDGVWLEEKNAKISWD